MYTGYSDTVMFILVTVTLSCLYWLQWHCHVYTGYSDTVTFILVTVALSC